MKIKVGLCDMENEYVERIYQYFCEKYPEEIEMYFIDDIQGMMNGEKPDIDILLITDAWVGFATEITTVPVLVLTDSNDAIEVAGIKAVGRYQKGSAIYKKIKEVYLTKTDVVYGFTEGNRANVVCFTGAAGGVGVTTAAVAYARWLAERSIRTFYLDLNVNSSMDMYFENKNEGDMGNVLLTLTSGNKNMRIIENYIQNDISGVDSFAPAASPFDMNDITPELAEQLIELIVQMGVYDEVIIDMGNRMSDADIAVLGLSNRVIIVSDGSRSSNMKNIRMVSALRESGRIDKSRMDAGWGILYNRFSDRTGMAADVCTLKNLGGINRIEYATEQDVEREIRKHSIWERVHRG
jgi:cellulose biosynthesis protein BcsQ